MARRFRLSRGRGNFAEEQREEKDVPTATCVLPRHRSTSYSTPETRLLHPARWYIRLTACPAIATYCGGARRCAGRIGPRPHPRPRRPPGRGSGSCPCRGGPSHDSDRVDRNLCPCPYPYLHPCPCPSPYPFSCLCPCPCPSPYPYHRLRCRCRGDRDPFRGRGLCRHRPPPPRRDFRGPSPGHHRYCWDPAGPAPPVAWGRDRGPFPSPPARWWVKVQEFKI